MKTTMSSWQNFITATISAVQKQGLRKTIYQVLSSEQPRYGTLVGTDAYGNQYYENKADIMNRNRWVIYEKWNWDGSQVPPEWHSWLHHISDKTPISHPVDKPKFFVAHVEHLTGTSSAYKPYSTVAPKIQAWDGLKPASRKI